MISAFGIEHGDISKGISGALKRIGNKKGIKAAEKKVQTSNSKKPWSTPKLVTSPEKPANQWWHYL